MNPNLITEEDLKHWLGYERRADLDAWLRDKGIEPKRGKGGRICILAADLAAAKAANPESFDDFEFASHGPTPSH